MLSKPRLPNLPNVGTSQRSDMGLAYSKFDVMIALKVENRSDVFNVPTLLH